MREFRRWLKALKMILLVAFPLEPQPKMRSGFGTLLLDWKFSAWSNFSASNSPCCKTRKEHFHYVPTEGLADVCEVFWDPCCEELWNANERILVLLKVLTALKITTRTSWFCFSIFAEGRTAAISWPYEVFGELLWSLQRPGERRRDSSER